ncbi:hypothetical protein CBP51_03155 [Cellvibrio mixtus]|uniref:Uncharacterized protein n=1 Tax=Cellvibrio mixtus TaxID=39650 RepID=A0A266Q830_9GAMM|nr:hypothetical protein [Cellvibrio mixtus]OZY86043.1 hypothetical protein CBP51_03155 [Cellvibrio mixtus]
MKLIDYKTYSEERKEHLNFLNTSLGGFALTVSLTCLQMNNAQLAINVCAPFIIALAVIGYKKFPPSIRLLRKLAKKNKQAAELNNHIFSTDYGLKALIPNIFPYICGYGFFIAVLLEPGFMKSMLNS